MFRRHKIRGESHVRQRQVGGLEPTGAREHVCGPGVILTTSAKGAHEGARVKIMPVGRTQTAGRASRSGACLAIGRRGSEILNCVVYLCKRANGIETSAKRRCARTAVEITEKMDMHLHRRKRVL